MGEAGESELLWLGTLPVGRATPRLSQNLNTGILLKAGANPNQTSLIRTPLAWACGNEEYTEGHFAVVKQLLAAGAEVDVPEGLRGIGHTPLHWAAERGYAEIVVELLKAGADPTLKERYEGNTPFDLATKHTHTAVAALLSEAMN